MLPSNRLDELTNSNRGRFLIGLLLCLFLLQASLFASAEDMNSYFIGEVDIAQAAIEYSNPMSGAKLSGHQTRELVIRLYRTKALNQRQAYQALGLQGKENIGKNFVTANPYFPRNSNTQLALPKPRSITVAGKTIENPEGYANPLEGYNGTAETPDYYQQEVVTEWFSDVSHGKSAASEVCAVRFSDEEKTRYQLKTFPSAQSALDNGFVITHQYQCGTCSTLQDLAVYMGVTDLTTPGRLCAKKGMGSYGRLDLVKQCYIEKLGFTEMCAESWAYNSLHTGKECLSDCMGAYADQDSRWPFVSGLFNTVVKEKFSACPAEVPTANKEMREQLENWGCPLANELTGKLNDCLWCDERVSGPGFKFSAARTRRASGLPSAIPRPNDKLFYQADHTQYFD